MRTSKVQTRSMVKTLFPKCSTCGALPECSGSHPQRSHYPGCFRPLRDLDLDRVAEIFAWWQRFHRLTDHRLTTAAQVLMGHLAHHGRRYSEVFEPSVSHDAEGWHLWRFSYAFPDWRENPDAVDQLVTDLARSLGKDHERWTSRLLRAARAPQVEQLLFGLAWDGPGALRLKVYFQLEESDDNEAGLALAERVTRCPDLRRISRGHMLHLLGIDLGQGGIVGAKLYFLRPEIDTSELSGVDLIDHLRGQGVRRLRGLLEIHRLAGPGDPGVEEPVEIDLALAKNNLYWPALALAPSVARVVNGDDPFSALSAEFEIAVRRISVAIDDGETLKIYYVPTAQAPRRD